MDNMHEKPRRGRPRVTDEKKRLQMTENSRKLKKEASKRYEAKFATMKLRMDKELRERITQHAAEKEASCNQYILDAVTEKMDREDREKGRCSTR